MLLLSLRRTSPFGAAAALLRALFRLLYFVILTVYPEAEGVYSPRGRFLVRGGKRATRCRHPGDPAEGIPSAASRVGCGADQWNVLPASIPPSTMNSEPVQYADSSDARNSTRLATSSGLPMRAIGSPL